ncbi:hypothetical protein M5689_013370 [Euphorbia peplus]|nr:hypothetical protein M5689_013370 [Euphorbia peplus]
MTVKISGGFTGDFRRSKGGDGGVSHGGFSVKRSRMVTGGDSGDNGDSLNSGFLDSNLLFGFFRVSGVLLVVGEDSDD